MHTLLQFQVIHYSKMMTDIVKEPRQTKVRQIFSYQLRYSYFFSYQLSKTCSLTFSVCQSETPITKLSPFYAGSFVNNAPCVPAPYVFKLGV